MTDADRVFAQNWVEQYRTNFYNDPDNALTTALQFVQSRSAVQDLIGGAFWWNQTPEVRLWSVRSSLLFESWKVLAR